MTNDMVSYRGVDEFISFSRILIDLLDSSGPRALQRHNIGLARKYGLILQVFHSKSCWLVDKTAYVKKIIALVDDRNCAVIAHEMILIPGQFRLYKSVLCPLVADQWLT